MNLLLKRRPSNAVCTIGDLYVDGEFECHTLEDPVRENAMLPVADWKIAGKTAIPAGTYKVIITWSPRFKRNLPLLVNVNGFVGVRIHAGNIAADTDGCIITGLVVAPDGLSVQKSRLAFDGVFEVIDAALDSGEDVFLTIENADGWMKQRDALAKNLT
ncbi:MAG: hypothetical protein ING73_11240 [Rhodocyclaceae bacterium]|nr:hypothetical protein [Rhodocyclaceae bacterium]